MLVSELIEYLKKQPQNLQVVYRCYSERCLLTEEDVEVEELCIPRNDGWVHHKRPDMPSKEYLVFPGN